MNRIIITTGDSIGIGLEVTTKALSGINIPRHTQIILMRSNKPCGRHAGKYIKTLHSKFKTVVVNTLSDALTEKDLESFDLIDVASDLSPAEWVVEAALACYENPKNILVTGPTSKGEFQNIKPRSVGHTDLFKKLFSTKDLYMLFVGNSFNVTLVTDHIPLKAVAKALTPDKIAAAIELSQRFLNSKKPSALVGLNPHAGESGILGSEEHHMQNSLFALLKKKKLKTTPFLVPDAAFLPNNWKKYSSFVCLYHDQGLIPFKMIHGHSGGVHVTLGLPFLRLSVDHGTATDIFDKNCAQFGSMKDALELAFKFTRQSRS
ncbi:MAG: 4-hydroxythreonine-4-phosphate dehydrogenase PdxA [Bdellovibrionia bacterium]